MKRWEIQTKGKRQKAKGKIEDIIHVLLQNRGLDTNEKVEEFLHPRLEDVTIASVGIDAKQVAKALKRIEKAIKEKEKIIIFGDYDVDGITGSAILWETLHALKADVMPYIPHRIEEGYGLSLKGIENVKNEYPDTSLIITVDNGIVASKAVDFANEKKIDVIITDHHTPPVGEGEKLPNAYAIVHTTKLCGAGVAWLLSKEMKREFSVIAIRQLAEKQSPSKEIAASPGVHRDSRNDDKEDKHLELATLGTIADLVPLHGANRAIVTYGMKKLCHTKRAGLLALFKQATCDQSTLGVYQISHVIAPRLNAAGRLDSAMDSLRLLCTPNEERAYELAEKLGKTNLLRQTIMKDSASHAGQKIRTANEVKKLLFIGDSSYQQGVIGLIAGKLVEEFYRPSIVLSIGEKYSKASVRSIHGVNIIEFLREASDLLVDVGGHPMAAGFTVETEKMPELQKRLEELAEVTIGDDLLIKTLRVDMEIDLSMITYEFYNSLQQLAPFGMGNPEPTFVSRNVEVVDKRLLGKEKNHVRFTVSSTNAELEAIGFGLAELAAEIQIGDTIDIVYTVDINEWNGNRKLQLKIKDVQQSN